MTQVAFKYQLKGDAVSNSQQCALFNCFSIFSVTHYQHVAPVQVTTAIALCCKSDQKTTSRTL